MGKGRRRIVIEGISSCCWPVTYGAFELRRHETANASSPGRVDYVKLMGARDGGYHEVNALESELEVLKDGIVDYGYLTVVIGFEFRVFLSTD